jgi:spoIIIJ-associated protein
MSDYMESTGKTVDEAIREALLRMGLRRDEVEVTVIQKDRGGLLGIGRRDAKVRVEKKKAGRRDDSRRGGRGRSEGQGERLDDGQDRGERRGSRRGRRGGRGRDQRDSRDSRDSREKRDDDRRTREPVAATDSGNDDRRDRRSDSDSDGEGRSRRRRRRPRRRKSDSAGEAVAARDEQQNLDVRDEAMDNAAEEQTRDRDQRDERDGGEGEGRSRRSRGGRGRGSRGGRGRGGRSRDDRDAEVTAETRAAEVEDDAQDIEVEIVETAAETVETTEPATTVARATDEPAPRATPAAPGEVLATDQVAIERVKPFASEDAAAAEAFLERVTTDLMVKSGFACRVNVKPGEYLQVKTVVDDRSAGVLIGRQGSTVDAVEYLVDKIAAHAAGERIRMNLDINNYRLRRHDSVEQRAMNAAAEARSTGEPVAMAPMHPRERRLVHLEIETLDDLVTYTAEGEDGKYVVICREDQVPAKYRDGAYSNQAEPATEANDTADAAGTIESNESNESNDTADTAEPTATAAAAGAETAAVITDDAEDDLDDDETRRDED